MDQYKVRIYPNSKSPRLFKNKVLEMLTWSHPVVITAIYFTLGTFLLYFFHSWHPEVSWAMIITVLIVGFFTWTLAEYFMHRFLYHDVHDATYSDGFHYMFHGIHHEYPNDESRVILPPVPSVLIASVILGVFYLLMRDWSFIFGTGFLVGYCAYMVIHYTVHRVTAPKRFSFWWTHHAIHHFQQHDRAFGVSTSIWDRVFGTMPEPMRKTVALDIQKEESVQHD